MGGHFIKKNREKLYLHNVLNNILLNDTFVYYVNYFILNLGRNIYSVPQLRRFNSFKMGFQYRVMIGQDSQHSQEISRVARLRKLFNISPKGNALSTTVKNALW